MAVIKGIIGQCILFTPKAFANGGYLFSNLSMVFGGVLSAICAVKLIKVAQKTGNCSYQGLVYSSLGPFAGRLLEFIIFSCQYSFTIGSILF